MVCAISRTKCRHEAAQRTKITLLMGVQKRKAQSTPDGGKKADYKRLKNQKTLHGGGFHCRVCEDQKLVSLLRTWKQENTHEKLAMEALESYMV